MNRTCTRWSGVVRMHLIQAYLLRIHYWECTFLESTLPGTWPLFVPSTDPQKCWGQLSWSPSLGKVRVSLVCPRKLQSALSSLENCKVLCLDYKTANCSVCTIKMPTDHFHASHAACRSCSPGSCPCWRSEEGSSLWHPLCQTSEDTLTILSQASQSHQSVFLSGVTWIAR